jgi:FlaA1/EpsC-like NDP-sugar epimerase
MQLGPLRRGDLKDAQFVDHLFKEYKFDYVYHLAAYAAEVGLYI